MAGPAIMAIKVIGDATGATKALDKAGGWLGKFTGKFGKAGPLIAAGIAAIPAAAVGAAKGLYNIGSEFDDMYDTIRVGTGASGQAFEQLKDSAKNVASQVPADFDKIGTALADVNTRTGLTGKTLETVSSQFLEAGRILGEDIDINKATGALNGFNITGKDTEAGMDTLFRVSQATGISMNDLAGVLGKNAPALQSLGFSFNESAAMAGMLNKAGLDANKTMTGMGKALMTLAKDGEKPADAFKRVTGQMQDMIARGDEAGALNLAGKLFGTRGAPQFIGALKSGAVNMDELAKAAAGSGDTILGVGKETADAAESWHLLKNNAKLALEPLASGVFNAVGAALGWIAEQAQKLTGGGGLSALGKAFDNPAFNQFGEMLTGIGTEVKAVFGQIVQTYTRLAQVMKPVFMSLAPVAINAFKLITGVIKNAFTIIKGAFTTIRGILTGDWSLMWNGIKTIATGAWSLITGAISGAWNLIKSIFNTGVVYVRTLWTTAWNAIKAIVTGVWGSVASTISGVWGRIKSAFTSGIARIKSIWTGGWNQVKSVVTGAFTRITGSIKSGISTAVSTVASLPGRAIRGLGNLGSRLYNSGRDFINGFIRGVGSMATALVNKVKNLAGNAVNAIKRKLGIASPSKVMAQIGRWTGQGFINGLEQIQPKVTAAATQLVQIPPAPAIRPSALVASAQRQSGSAAAPVVNNHFTINGALDPTAVARQIQSILSRATRANGRIQVTQAGA